MIPELISLSFTEQLQWVQNRINIILLKKIHSLPSNSTKLIDAMKYSILIGGRRLRSFLIYTIGSTLNISIKNLDIFAAAIECIHIYSLIHDDLPAMDNDIYRRGKYTCHISFSEAHAILAGDALQALAFNILSNSNMPDINDNNRLNIISELSNAIGVAGMCSGQALDIESSKKNISTKNLYFIHKYKTASLIRVAIKICVIASSNQNYIIVPLLDTYAKTIGLLLQIKDDLNDFKKDNYLTKDNIYKKKHKQKTYPILIGIKQTYKQMIKLHKRALNILNILEKKHKINIKTLENITHFIIK